LLKEAEYLNQAEESPSKVIKVLKVGESIELVEGGANIPVTTANVGEFIRLTKEKIHEIVFEGVTAQTKAFLSGFKKVIDPKIFKKFTAEELRDLA
jgi:hypothetical protein